MRLIAAYYGTREIAQGYLGTKPLVLKQIEKIYVDLLDTILGASVLYNIADVVRKDAKECISINVSSSYNKADSAAAISNETVNLGSAETISINIPTYVNISDEFNIGVDWKEVISTNGDPKAFALETGINATALAMVVIGNGIYVDAVSNVNINSSLYGTISDIILNIANTATSVIGLDISESLLTPFANVWLLDAAPSESIDALTITPNGLSLNIDAMSGADIKEFVSTPTNIALNSNYPAQISSDYTIKDSSSESFDLGISIDISDEPKITMGDDIISDSEISVELEETKTISIGTPNISESDISFNIKEYSELDEGVSNISTDSIDLISTIQSDTVESIPVIKSDLIETNQSTDGETIIPPPWEWRLEQEQNVLHVERVWTAYRSANTVEIDPAALQAIMTLRVYEKLTVTFYLYQELGGLHIHFGDGSPIGTVNAIGRSKFAHTFPEPGDYVIRFMTSELNIWSPGTGYYNIVGGYITEYYSGKIDGKKVEGYIPKDLDFGPAGVGPNASGTNPDKIPHEDDISSPGLMSFVFSSSNSILSQSTAFYKCTSISTITIPNNTKFIPSYSFYGCSSLHTVNLSSTITSINEYAFWGCYQLSNINLLNNITTIGEAAFYGCNNLNISLPDTLTRLGLLAFSHTAMSIDALPSTLDTVGSYAFSNCQNITNMRIYSRVVKQNCFAECENLRAVWISSSCEMLGYDLFYGCDKELIIFCEPNEKPSGWETNFDLLDATTHAQVIWGISYDTYKKLLVMPLLNINTSAKTTNVSNEIVAMHLDNKDLSAPQSSANADLS